MPEPLPGSAAALPPSARPARPTVPIQLLTILDKRRRLALGLAAAIVALWMLDSYSAVPLYRAAPSLPNHGRDWFYGLLVASAMGMGVAFLVEYFDDTLKTPDDVVRHLELGVLGLVPAVRDAGQQLLSSTTRVDLKDAFSSLRASLVFQVNGGRTTMLAVTSTEPRERSCTTTVNIAAALAMSGSRVLLIDANLRKPGVNKALRLTNDRGLSQLLSGQARMRDVVQRTHHPNLLVITAGRVPANPSEFLASDRMRALMAGLENGPFEWVLIDMPPVPGDSDAALIAPLVTAVILVIGAETTPRTVAVSALHAIRSGNPRLITTVLNNVDFARNRYYYSRYRQQQHKGDRADAPAA